MAPDGRKIKHSHERRRSQEVIDRILGNDRKKKTEDDINLAKQYTFSSFAQFKAIMVSMGYEVYQKDEDVFVKHGGKVQKDIPLSEIESLFKSGYHLIVLAKNYNGYKNLIKLVSNSWVEDKKKDMRFRKRTG